MHEYLGGTVKGLDGISQGVGGTADHVHLLVGLKPTHCLSDFLRELKKSSSVWAIENRGCGVCLAERLRSIHSQCVGLRSGTKIHCWTGRASSTKNISGRVDCFFAKIRGDLR
jgi:hypothetical protein